jgi:putative Holliday junction resolvase
MRYLGFDMGTKKIGVAYSDEGGEFAFAGLVILNDTQLFSNIFDLCQKYNPEAFVVGLSDSGTSQSNVISKHITRFVSELEARFGLPVFTMNEHGTSQAVRNQNTIMSGQKYNQATKRAILENKQVDAAAAALMLQRYLDQVNPVSRHEDNSDY